jgi:antitoxin HigA-1
MTSESLPVEAPMHTPPHPGRIVRQDCIEALGLTIGEAAEALGVTRQTLDRLVNERGGISPEMALRLAKAFGSTPDLWLRLQATHDLTETRKRKAEELGTIRRLDRASEGAPRKRRAADPRASSRAFVDRRRSNATKG